MKIRRKGREEEGLELCFEGFKQRTDPELAGKSIPASRSIVRERSFSKRSERCKSICGKCHFKWTRNDKFLSKKGRSRAVKTTESKHQGFEMDALFHSQPMKFS